LKLDQERSGFRPASLYNYYDEQLYGHRINNITAGLLQRIDTQYTKFASQFQP
jgi:hypothetical protein